MTKLQKFLLLCLILLCAVMPIIVTAQNMGIKDTLNETGQGIAQFSDSAGYPIGRMFLFFTLVLTIAGMVAGIIGGTILTIITKHLRG
jgi:hypothetical protein